MRTNIVIDDMMMKEAKKLGSYKTKKETVEAALKLLIRLKGQSKIKDFRGKLLWKGEM